jgi:hypothetical protein
MPISAHLQRKLQDVLGTDAGEDLVTLLETVEATRGDIGELRHEMQVGFARIETTFERALREQTRFFFVAWALILAAIIGLSAR